MASVPVDGRVHSTSCTRFRVLVQHEVLLQLFQLDVFRVYGSGLLLEVNYGWEICMEMQPTPNLDCRRHATWRASNIRFGLNLRYKDTKVSIAVTSGRRGSQEENGGCRPYVSLAAKRLARGRGGRKLIE